MNGEVAVYRYVTIELGLLLTKGLWYNEYGITDDEFMEVKQLNERGFHLKKVAFFDDFDIINAWQHFNNKKSVSQNKLCN